MKPISPDEHKQLQLALLDDFHNYCVRHGLRYSLYFGTLLGAIRHRGFIPWDDDIDIAMPRADYEQFVARYSHAYYKVYDHRHDANYVLPYAKVADTRTILEEACHMDNIGINIDIFPFDAVGDTREEAASRIRRLHATKLLFRIKLLRPSPKNVWWKRIAIRLGKVVVWHLTLKQLTQRLYRQFDAMQLPPHATYIASVMEATTPLSLASIIESEVMDNFTDVEFEGKHYRAVADYDHVLTLNYGDYMTPPPPSQRTSPHTVCRIYWVDQ